MYAIIETGGKQYKIREGDTVDVELLDGDIGDTVELDQVLMISGDDEMMVGKPTVEDALVRATVVDEVRGDKVVVFKYKPSNRYRRKTGHRQNYTRLQIEKITAPGLDTSEPEEEEEDVAETAPVETPEAELTSETSADVEPEITDEPEPSVETEFEEPDETETEPHTPEVEEPADDEE